MNTRNSYLIQRFSNLIVLITFIMLSPAHSMNKPNIYGLEPVSKKAHLEVDDYSKLMDAAIYGTKSRFYQPSYKPAYYHDGENDGTTPLHRAIIAGDVQDCINQIAIGCKWRIPLVTGDTYLHIAARQGFNSFCEFMLMHGFRVNTPRGTTSHTALVMAAEAKKLSTCKLLLEHGAHPITRNLDYTWDIFSHFASAPDLDVKTFFEVCKKLAIKQKDRTPTDVVEVPGNATFDLALHKPEPQHFKRLCKIMPCFILLGEGPEARDLKNKTPLCRLLRQHADAPKDLQMGLLHCVVTYQPTVELAQLRALKTLLLIHNYCPDSIIARLPIDILRTSLYKFFVPFRAKNVQECVNDQLTLMRRLLEVSYNKESVAELITSQSTLQERNDILGNIAIMDPAKVEQHRPHLATLTQMLMGLPAEPKTS